MNEGLFSAYSSLPQWQELLEATKTTGCSAVYELAEGERPFLAAALSQRTGRPVVLVCSTELIAQRCAQDIQRLTGMGCVCLPPRDLQFSRAASSRESTWQRLSALDQLAHGQARVLCISLDSLIHRCVPKKVFLEAEIRIVEGECHPPKQLMDRLLAAGYERVAMVEGQGQCAMRGSILDVFPSNTQEALRIEFFDDEVDSIRRFECISQRSIARVKNARIAPATECLVTDPEKAAQRLRKAIEAGLGHGLEELPNQYVENPDRYTAPVVTEAGEELPSLDEFLMSIDLPGLSEDEPGWAAEETEMQMGAMVGEKAGKTIGEYSSRGSNERNEVAEVADPDGGKVMAEAINSLSYRRHLDDVERVAAGQTIRTAPMWLNVLCRETATAMDYLDKPIVLLDRPEHYLSRMRVLDAEFSDAYESARQRGDAFDAQKDLLLPYDDLLPVWQGLPSVLLTDLNTGTGKMKPEKLVSFGSTTPLPYQSRLEPLCNDIKKWKEQNCAIVLLCGGEARALRLQKALSERGMPSSYAETLDGNVITREVILLPVSYTKGFLNMGARLCLISDTDLYGSAYHKARKKSNAGERISSFTDLKPGDYIVHDLHGVGIYQGVTQMNDEGVKRDYLIIHYAGSDKLYVPADQFDRVQKYIGAEAALPKLNKLGGSEWQRQKSRVKGQLKKLAFDLVALYAKRAQENGYAFSHENPWQREFEDAFPYELTDDQQRSVAQIEEDMESARNMDRLLCGDVGYGKTEVALRAAFKCVVEGKQVAILAPTTILVQQHYNTIRKRFSGFPAKVEMLSRFRTPAESKEIIKKLEAGEIDIIVGTHRLLSKEVKYHDLGLLIVDEEQRFGVAHKESIKQMKNRVDVLTLSATPIPRTLHMSMVGIRDMSILETPPEERLPVKTYVLEYDDMIIRDAIRRELARDGQVYFLYNRVRSIDQMYARLHALVPEARIGIAHGQMRENALEDIMLDFYAGAYDILLCTTIVESGLDVPEANTLIVFDADRFGLSQLYQIRGRVGRSNKQAYAYFTTRANKQMSETAQKRLDAIREFTEFGAGYRIAMRDLEIRGAGDVLGPQQSGHLSTVGYDMYCKLIEEAVGEARGITQTPELDTRIDLKIDAYLPQDYVSQEKLRVEIYKRIAMVVDEETRMTIEDELIDRFGDIPQPVENLIRIAQLRGVTRQLGVSHLTLRQDGLHLKLSQQAMPDPGVLFTAVSVTDPRLKFGVGRTPELVFQVPRLTPAVALDMAIPMVTALHRNVVKLLQEKAAAEEAQKDADA
ncbi:MAG: transcription-repair coupling factor [Clostridiales bacterium]|nr:transcription-repair coupling factor [Clostridiales bacterium]